MAEKKKLLDVWIVDLNTVYREVPFAVVTDWLQEGRLLPQDKVRLAGTAAWHLLAKVPAFKPYLPRPEPARANDQAEALEPVEVGLDWKRPGEAEDEDVDMIPLIDISLVLLIFFMMTTAISSGMFTPIKTPAARHQLLTISKDMFWVGIDIKLKDGRRETGADGKVLPLYSFGKENEMLIGPVPEETRVVSAFEEALKDIKGDVRIRIRAHEDLPANLVRDMTLGLKDLEARLNQGRGKAGKITLAILGEVSEQSSK